MKKQNEITIETPEKIRFSYQIAEIGTRIAAYVIDEIIQIIIMGILALLLVLNHFSLPNPATDGINNLATAFFLIMIFILRWFYFVLFEVVMEGQSPGKRAMRVRVIQASGDSLDIQTIILRNFLRVVDGFPVIPLVGGFIALIDSRNRRMGDLVADTLVVKEVYFDLKLPDFYVYFKHGPQNGEERISFKKRRLTEQELFILRRFLNEYQKLPSEKQNTIAQSLAQQVRNRLGVDEESTDAFLFLERIYQQHAISN